MAPEPATLPLTPRQLARVVGRADTVLYTVNGDLVVTSAVGGGLDARCERGPLVGRALEDVFPCDAATGLIGLHRRALDGQAGELRAHLRDGVYDVIVEPLEAQGQQRGAVVLAVVESEPRPAGVAHDLRNMLAVIRGYSQLLIAAEPSGGSGRPELEEIARAAERAVSLTEELLELER